MVGYGEMLGLWSIRRDLETMLEWDCAFPLPPLLPVGSKICRMMTKLENGWCVNGNDGGGDGGWKMGPR